MILVCAWSISGLTKSMNIGQFLTGVVQDSIPAALIPAILFLIGVVVSFATGSSWGVWALGMPIALPMANAMGIPLTLAIGAVVSGGLFGDHCSPISDTTIQSSTSACCDHLQHVKTQLPYALTVGISSLIGFLFAGLVAPVLALPVTLVCIIAALLVMKNISRKTGRCGCLSDLPYLPSKRKPPTGRFPFCSPAAKGPSNVRLALCTSEPLLFGKMQTILRAKS